MVHELEHSESCAANTSTSRLATPCGEIAAYRRRVGAHAPAGFVPAPALSSSNRTKARPACGGEDLDGKKRPRSSTS
jgi:hypothetical protein